MGIAGHLVDCGVSAGAGGVFGLVGHLAARVAGYLEAKRDYAARQAERAHELDLLKLQLQWCQPETEVAPAELRVASLLSPADRAGLAYRWVDEARALVRPLLTLGLSAVLAAAFFSMAPDDVARVSVADSLTFVTVTAIVWWFGDRALTRKS